VAYDDDYRHEMVPVFRAARGARSARAAATRAGHDGGALMKIRPIDAVRDARPAEVWETLARWRAVARRFALASVIESRGFTPRKPGAHMLVAEDGETCGTIAAAPSSSRCWSRRGRCFEGGGSSLVRKHLNPGARHVLRREMAVFLEVLEPAPRLLLFGAGYIGRALAALAARPAAST